MAVDTMRVRLHLRLIRVLTVLVDTPTRLEVEVASTRSWSRCPFCGFKTRTVHDRRRRKIRDLPVSGRRVTLVWIRRRFSCANCDARHLEDHGEFEGGLTRRLARQLVADAKVMSIRAVVRRHGLNWHLIQDLVDVWSALVAEHRRSQRCRVLLVDETSMRKRHRYVTVIQNGDTGQVLAMVEHRNAAALSGFFIEQGPRWCRGVQVVVSDGSKSYKAAIDAHLGHARHVLDRFHVVRWFAAGLTLVRRDLQRRQPAGVKPAFDPDVFRARFALLRNEPTTSTNTTRPASPSSSPPTQGCEPAGKPSKNSTASTSPMTVTAHSKRLTGSPTSTSPANLASSITSSTPSLPGATRSWPGTVRAGPPTAESKAPTTSSKSYAASPTASPTPTTSPPADCS